MNNPLKWDVFVSSQIPAVTGELPPGATELKWSPISSALVSGERDAVLVDTFITMEQNRELILLAPYGRTEAVASLGNWMRKSRASFKGSRLQQETPIRRI